MKETSQKNESLKAIGGTAEETNTLTIRLIWRKRRKWQIDKDRYIKDLSYIQRKKRAKKKVS